MLYDYRRWEKVKAAPFTMESLIAWAERQPADQEYDYWDHQRCFLGQYFEAHGFHVVQVGCGYVNVGHDVIKLPPHFDEIAKAEPRTFGAALARALAIGQRA